MQVVAGVARGVPHHEEGLGALPIEAGAVSPEPGPWTPARPGGRASESAGIGQRTCFHPNAGFAHASTGKNPSAGAGTTEAAGTEAAGTDPCRPEAGAGSHSCPGGGTTKAAGIRSSPALKTWDEREGHATGQAAREFMEASHGAGKVWTFVLTRAWPWGGGSVRGPIPG